MFVSLGIADADPCAGSADHRISLAQQKRIGCTIDHVLESLGAALHEHAVGVVRLLVVVARASVAHIVGDGGLPIAPATRRSAHSASEVPIGIVVARGTRIAGTTKKRQFGLER